jgi:hypothetical protein
LALIECNECGNEVSENAESCPECGNPISPDSDNMGCAHFFKIALGMVSVGVVFVLLIGLISFLGEPTETSSDRVNNIDKSTQEAEPPPAEKMFHVFSGNPREQKIRRKLNEAIDKFNMPKNDDSKMNIGDILLTLRRKYDVKEMKILTCANASSPNFTNFKRAAATCVARLED